MSAQELQIWLFALTAIGVFVGILMSIIGYFIKRDVSEVRSIQKDHEIRIQKNEEDLKLNNQADLHLKEMIEQQFLNFGEKFKSEIERLRNDIKNLKR